MRGFRESVQFGFMDLGAWHAVLRGPSRECRDLASHLAGMNDAEHVGLPTREDGETGAETLRELEAGIGRGHARSMMA